MKKPKIIIVGRLDEVSSITSFTMTSFNRDILLFRGYKPAKYTTTFVTTLVAKQAAVNGIINPLVLTGELKLITSRIINNTIGLREPLNLLEGYIVDAVDLTVAYKDFGLSDVRKKISSGDVEGLNGHLGVLLTNIDNNMPKLITAGFTEAGRIALADTKSQIFTDNGLQNAKETERAALVSSNINLINDYLLDIKGIWADGKRLFKVSDKVKLADYTNSALIRRIRNDELHTFITGRVINKLGETESGAKIKARPLLDGKRGKTIKSDANGNYELKGLRPATYLLTVTLKNGGMFLINVDAITNQTVTQDLVQPD